MGSLLQVMDNHSTQFNASYRWLKDRFRDFHFSFSSPSHFFYKLECWAHCKKKREFLDSKALSKLLCEASVLQALVVDSLHGDPGPYLVID